MSSDSEDSYEDEDACYGEKVPLAQSDPKEYWRRVRGLYASSVAVILGNVLEWYDWTVYGYMQDVLKEVFTGGDDAESWLVFAIPFVVRPFGSILFGWIGDKFGRTISLNLAIWGMALATVLHGCLPRNAVWMLSFLRVISGLSAGGEAAGVNTYMTEFGGKSKEDTMAAAVGVNNVSGSLAFFVANAVSLAVHQLPRSDQIEWGWRIPFLLAAPIGLISILLRRRMHETEDFKVAQQSEESDKEVDRCCSDALWNTRAVVLVVLVIAAINSCNYLPVYLSSWLRDEAGLTDTTALSITAVAKITQIMMTFPASYAGDRYGATATMLVGGMVTALAAVPALLVVTNADADAVVVTGFMVLGVMMPIPVGLYLVPSNLYMTSLFPTQFRGRGAGIGLGLASVVGGLTPMICTSLAKRGALYPGYFITGVALPSLLTLLWSRWAIRRGVLEIYQRLWLY